LVFVVKPLLYSISIYYWTMKNHFVQVKKPHTQLLVSFSSIKIMA